MYILFQILILAMTTVLSKPGFALESVDVYETSDLPEADQHLFGHSDGATDSIETLSISANEAFGSFMGA